MGRLVNPDQVFEAMPGMMRSQSGVALKIVSKCPQCGAPIYGSDYHYSNGPGPEIKYTCTCRQDKGNNGLNMQTK